MTNWKTKLVGALCMAAGLAIVWYGLGAIESAK